MLKQLCRPLFYF